MINKFKPADTRHIYREIADARHIYRETADIRHIYRDRSAAANNPIISPKTITPPYSQPS